MVVMMLVVFAAIAATAAAAVIVNAAVVVTVMMMMVVVSGVRCLLMLENGDRGFWPGCQAAVVANAKVRKTRAAGSV